MTQINGSSSRLDSVASYITIATAVLAPLAFWPSQYFAVEAVKTILLAVGTLTSAALYIILALREKSLRLPPRSMVWIGSLLALATIISSAQSSHFMKSFFGQGFEVGTGSFLLLMLVAGWVAFTVSTRKIDRIMVIYSAIGASFLVLYILHAFRFLMGAGFATFGILGSLTTTFLGTWYSVGIFSGVIVIIALASILMLPLPAKFKNLYWVLIALSVFGMFIIGAKEIWEAALLVFLGLGIYFWKSSRKSSYVTLGAAVIALVMIFQGTAMATPVINSMNAGFSELSLPWQMTLDVAAGELKAQPLFGTGPNRFSQAFLTYKPAGINQSDLWGVEFNSGFGLIPTFIVTEGIVGSIMWALFFVFFGILGYSVLRKTLAKGNSAVSQTGEAVTAEAEQPYARFAVVSSFFAASFLWIMSLLYVMPHTMVYYAFVMTGLFLGAAVSYGHIRFAELSSQPGARMAKVVPFLTIIFLALVIIWGLVFIKDTVALAYFDQGLKELTVSGNPSAADKDFSTALSLHPTDIFWQGRAEAVLGEARQLINSAASAGSQTPTSQVATQATALVNQALQYAQNAVAADSSNYYNYLSAARVAEVASTLKMDKSYDAGIAAYVSAIRLNPQNPSLYVSLARFQAANNKLDDAIQTIGASLQVKNNYLESVFLLSQVEAVKGNLPDATTAAAFAVKLNPQNPLLYFQLGLFQYTAGKYSDAAVTLSQAVKLQPDYANAKYFYGLALARLGQYSDSITQFQDLATSNPTNQEIPAILAALKSGKSLFGGPTPALPTAPEKRSTLPLPEKRK